MTHFIKYNPKLKEVARQLRINATNSEKKIWDFLRKEFPYFHFARQKPLDQFIPDFYCNKLKLIIEIDGEIHNLQKERDSEKDIQSVKLELEKYMKLVGTGSPSFLKEGVRGCFFKTEKEVLSRV